MAEYTNDKEDSMAEYTNDKEAAGKKSKAAGAERLVKVKLQKVKGKGKGKFVSVNDHRFFIPYGQVVEVPAYIKEVLENSMAQDEKTAIMIENLTGQSEF